MFGATLHSLFFLTLKISRSFSDFSEFTLFCFQEIKRTNLNLHGHYNILLGVFDYRYTGENFTGCFLVGINYFPTVTKLITFYFSYESQLKKAVKNANKINSLSVFSQQLISITLRGNSTFLIYFCLSYFCV